jgi:hypothetical protein
VWLDQFMKRVYWGEPSESPSKHKGFIEVDKIIIVKDGPFKCKKI